MAGRNSQEPEALQIERRMEAFLVDAGLPARSEQELRNEALYNATQNLGALYPIPEDIVAGRGYMHNAGIEQREQENPEALAAQRNEALAQVRALVQGGADLSYSRSFLTLATGEAEDISAADRLSRAGIDPQTLVAANQTVDPAVALEAQRAERLSSQLTDIGAQQALDDELMRAARHGNTERTYELLEAGANPDREYAYRISGEGVTRHRTAGDLIAETSAQNAVLRAGDDPAVIQPVIRGEADIPAPTNPVIDPLYDITETGRAAFQAQAGEEISGADKQRILEGLSYATDSRGADGIVDGDYGRRSQQAERAFANDYVTGRVTGADPELLAAAVNTFGASIRSAIATDLGINDDGRWTAAEKQTILEHFGHGTDAGGADGRVDGIYGSRSQQAEENLAMQVASGAVNGMDPQVLAMAREAFSSSIENAQEVLSADGPTQVSGIPPDALERGGRG